MEEQAKKANAFSFMLEGWEEKRGSPVGGPGYDNLEGLVQGTLIRDVFEAKHKTSSPQKRRGKGGARSSAVSPSPERRDVTASDFGFEKEVRTVMDKLRV